MSMGGGGGGGGQAIVQSGPSLAAAGQAAQQQVLAAQAASQAATRNTHSAIQALQQQYGTALTYANPIINTGNQAAAQLSYMLGLGAVAPGLKPTAPTMPTLDTALNDITNTDINAYIAQNTFTGSYNTNAGTFGYTNYMGGDFQNSYATQPGPDGPGNIGVPTMGLVASLGVGGQYGLGNALGNETIRADAERRAAEQNLRQNLLPEYKEALTNYNQNEAQWQAEDRLYKQYAAKGVATPADLTNVVQNLPGYQFQMQQGTNAIQNLASSKGMLNSGALLQQLNEFGQGQASTYYNNYLNQLQSLAGYGAGATQQATGGAANLGNQVAGQYSNLGQDQANAYLAAGQAQASSYLTPLANQQTNIQQIGGGGGSGWGSALGSGLGLLGSFMSPGA